MNEYERIFSKILIEYGGKCPRMREKRLNYLNEYTRLLGTSEYKGLLYKRKLICKMYFTLGTRMEISS